MFNWLFKKKKATPPIFAKKGEEVTCENGHVICEVAQDIYVGDLHAPHRMTRWRQPEPTIADATIKCGVCGALFWHGFNGQHFHFVDGWRNTPPVVEVSIAAAK